MPKVGDKEFSYTPEGVKAAKKESLQSGIPMNDASARNEQTFAGSGNANFNSIGAAPKINPGGNTMNLGNMSSPMSSNNIADSSMNASDIYYKKGGKVDRKTKKAIKKHTKTKVSLGDARDEDIQKHYGTEGKPFKTRRAIKKNRKNLKKELTKAAKEGKLKVGKAGSMMYKKGGKVGVKPKTGKKVPSSMELKFLPKAKKPSWAKKMEEKKRVKLLKQGGKVDKGERTFRNTKETSYASLGKTKKQVGEASTGRQKSVTEETGANYHRSKYQKKHIKDRQGLKKDVSYEVKANKTKVKKQRKPEKWADRFLTKEKKSKRDKKILSKELGFKVK